MLNRGRAWLVTGLLAWAGGAGAQSLPAVNGTHWTRPLKAIVNSSPANFQAEHYDSDINYFVTVNGQSPHVNVIEPARWDSRTSGTRWLASIPFPATFTIADIAPPDTPNNPLTVYRPDTGEVWRLNGAVRPQAGGSIYAYMGDATHGGSGLSGGEVTGGELKQNLIPHALAVNVLAKRYLSFANGVGFVPPAIRADSYASYENYGGANPLIKMGSKLAIPRSVTASALGLHSPDALTVLKALQEYGAYIVDDTAWDAFAINADPVAGPRLNAITPEILALYSALQVVTGEADAPLFSQAVDGAAFASRPVGGYAGNYTWNVWSNGAISQPITVPAAGTYTITIVASGIPSNGIWPIMSVAVDGKTLKKLTVGSGTLANYTAPELRVTLSKGTHTIAVGLTNDSGPRDLLVRRATIQQQR
jgi:hypothetical protein